MQWHSGRTPGRTELRVGPRKFVTTTNVAKECKNEKDKKNLTQSVCKISTFYSVSQKNTPDIFSCNLNKYFPISIIFGTRIT